MTKIIDARLIQRFQPLFGEESRLVPRADPRGQHGVWGQYPLEIYIQTKEQKYLDMGQSHGGQAMENPTPEGLTPQTRFWIDDMYMVTIVQLQPIAPPAIRNTATRAAIEMSAYLDKLQQPNVLFYHAPDVPFFWGSGEWLGRGGNGGGIEFPASESSAARPHHGGVP